MENITNDIPKPLIDMAPLCSPKSDESDFFRIGKEMVKSFEDPGFVYLKNFGIQTEEIKALVKAADIFFDLDYELQGKFYRDSETYHGFSNEFTELLNFYTPLAKRTTRCMFDIQGLDEPFPDEVPELKHAATPIVEKLVPITNSIMKAIEVGLEYPAGFLVDKHKSLFGRGSLSDLRIVKYISPASTEQTVRCEAHNDFSTVTLQFYGDLDGLQILDSKGEWQTAKLYPGYALLFPSEQLQLMTDGRIKAATHQVLNPSASHDIDKIRHAVIFFPNSDIDADIRPYNHSEDYPLITGKEFAVTKSKIYFQKGPLKEMGKWDITPLV